MGTVVIVGRTRSPFSGQVVRRTCAAGLAFEAPSGGSPSALIRWYFRLRGHLRASRLLETSVPGLHDGEGHAQTAERRDSVAQSPPGDVDSDTETSPVRHSRRLLISRKGTWLVWPVRAALTRPQDRA